MGLITPVELPNPDELGAVHFIAIGGSGMNGIASMMLAAGIRVSGSDGRTRSTCARWSTRCAGLRGASRRAAGRCPHGGGLLSYPGGQPGARRSSAARAAGACIAARRWAR